MNEKEFFRIRLYFAGFASISIGALLMWNHFHGGVPSHHVLADETLPLISNWWGILVIPLLTLLLTYRIQKRIYRPNDQKTSILLKQVIFGFLVALSFGILLAFFFAAGNQDMPGYMILGLLPLAFFFPIYRAECLLGFVFGMTYTFGAVLPMGIGSLLVLIGAGIYLLLRPAIIYVGSKLIRSGSSVKNQSGGMRI
ncbi:hypothetical protein [Algoriphagus antarcticus]|uniref:Uncharacterized protein n=1 Tax=Algoriphagus antarcticus TaxID=238540 RepID=A0A3E0DWQ0_9BACT|nr:hypothetical protein [Algoriphagus antarcticus]REG88290.1 hypothetical protein C8N25_11068 [Algoriphagus antarcticus]